MLNPLYNQNNLELLGENVTVNTHQYSYENQELWKFGSYYSVDRVPINILDKQTFNSCESIKIKYEQTPGEIIVNSHSVFFIPEFLNNYIKLF